MIECPEAIGGVCEEDQEIGLEMRNGVGRQCELDVLEFVNRFYPYYLLKVVLAALFNLPETETAH